MCSTFLYCAGRCLANCLLEALGNRSEEVVAHGSRVGKPAVEGKEKNAYGFGVDEPR